MLVAAVAGNGAIGVDGGLPWNLPEDLAHFKAITMGKPIIMGRATFESIGRALPERTNIVLTRQADWTAPGVLVADTPPRALHLARGSHPHGDICIIGGGQIYELFLPLATRLEITAIEVAPDGDAHFPPWDPRDWVLVSADARQGPPPFTFQTWRRASAEGNS